MRVANIFGLENEDDVEAAVRKKFELFSLDDDNFVKPGHNPRVKEPALCEPQVYETNNTE